MFYNGGDIKMAEPQKTPLYKLHLDLKGVMVDYGGWLLPVQYEGIIAEVNGTRSNAGLFDVSHMGEFLVEGPQAAAFLQGAITNNIYNLYDNRIIYSPVCYHDGGTVDDILVYRYHEQKYLLVVNAANRGGDYTWLAEKIVSGVNLQDISEETALLAVQGPRSLSILQALAKTDLQKLKYYHFIPRIDLAGLECMISRTGYTGEDGFEVYTSPEKAQHLYEAILDHGQTHGLGLTPAGLGARDVLRLEASLPLYGHELSKDITPWEAGLDRFISLDKGEFVGREALWRQKREGLSRKLAGLVLLDRGVLREGYPVYKGDMEIGFVSSGTYSPTLKKSIGMTFLPPECNLPGTGAEVIIRGKPHRAEIIKMPFYRRGSK